MQAVPGQALPLPLRVALVAPTFNILGGHSVQAAAMLDGWQRDPHIDAWLVPINPDLPAPLAPLAQVRYARTIATQACYWPLLVRELRRADVVHVFSASSTGFALSTVPAVLVATALGKPVVLNYHSGAAPDHLASSRLARLLLRDVVAINVVPSRFLQEVFSRFGLRASVVFNSIDLDRFPYRARPTIAPRLLSTRNFEALYNVACTLRAFAHIQKQHPDATLTLIGAGSQDGPLRALAATLRLRHVTFVGRVRPADMPAYYADADVYVQTPSIDNMPLSVLEAFASGLPVVSTRVGGVPSILTDGVHGLLADDDDDRGVAAHVLALLANPDRARSLAAAAYGTCRAYEWHSVRDGWLSVYRQVFESTSHRRIARVEPA
jgi:glycosyltransferase involved in cell wall biosynthesis